MGTLGRFNPCRIGWPTRAFPWLGLTALQLTTMSPRRPPHSPPPPVSGILADNLRTQRLRNLLNVLRHCITPSIVIGQFYLQVIAIDYRSDRSLLRLRAHADQKFPQPCRRPRNQPLAGVALDDDRLVVARAYRPTGIVAPDATTLRETMAPPNNSPRIRAPVHPAPCEIGLLWRSTLGTKSTKSVEADLLAPSLAA